MKKILFVMNTLGKAGAEVALMELLRRLSLEKDEDGKRAYDVSIYVLTGQGEMVRELPDGVKLLNKKYRDVSVLSEEGRKYLARTVVKALLKRANFLRLFPYLAGNLALMLKKGSVKPDKLLWRVLSDGAERLDEEYDLAVAYLEGGSTYYLADHVNAKRKAAFVHVDYNRAGYTRKLDRECYPGFSRIFTVSDEVKAAFLKTYPECRDKTFVFHNLLNAERIRKKSTLPGGFADSFDGMRILTVGRLEKQKALEISIAAMKKLKDEGICARWYVLGEGSERRNLTEEIEKKGLTEDFILCGAVENPYPYMRQADFYVHASRFEGKSIAIQEAQILGKPMVVSDCSGNREQVKDEENGLMCELDAGKLAEKIKRLIRDKELRDRLGSAAMKVQGNEEAQMGLLTELLV